MIHYHTLVVEFRLYSLGLDLDRQFFVFSTGQRKSLSAVFHPVVGVLSLARGGESDVGVGVEHAIGKLGHTRAELVLERGPEALVAHTVDDEVAGMLEDD